MQGRITRLYTRYIIMIWNDGRNLTTLVQNKKSRADRAVAGQRGDSAGQPWSQIV